MRQSNVQRLTDLLGRKDSSGLVACKHTAHSGNKEKKSIQERQYKTRFASGCHSSSGTRTSYPRSLPQSWSRSKRRGTFQFDPGNQLANRAEALLNGEETALAAMKSTQIEQSLVTRDRWRPSRLTKHVLENRVLCETGMGKRNSREFSRV